MSQTWRVKQARAHWWARRRVVLSADEIKADDAAVIVGLGRSTVYRLFHAGLLGGRQASPRVIYISRSAAMAWRTKTSEPGFWESEEGMRARELMQGCY
jgi:predicted DNA-binding transcriptional regulator AlpA